MSKWCCDRAGPGSKPRNGSQINRVAHQDCRPLVILRGLRHQDENLEQLHEVVRRTPAFRLVGIAQFRLQQCGICSKYSTSAGASHGSLVAEYPSWSSGKERSPAGCIPAPKVQRLTPPGNAPNRRGSWRIPGRRSVALCPHHDGIGGGSRIRISCARSVRRRVVPVREEAVVA